MEHEVLGHKVLVTADASKKLDNEASAEWGMDSYALVEAAGRACARAYAESLLPIIPAPHSSCAVLAGSGNNAADALVMLRALLLDNFFQPRDCSVFITRYPDSNRSPLSQAVLAIKKLNVPVMEWNADTAAAVLEKTNIIIDGISGTGLQGPLNGAGLEMAETLNKTNGKNSKPFVISVDIPSGNFDGWQKGMPVVTADATLAIEPQKLCLYTPAARVHGGTIIPVNGIIHPALIKKYGNAELVCRKKALADIPPVSKTAHKYERGLAEIRAGSQGTAGAALLASQGAQAAGAGMIRLLVDPSLYPLIAPACSGVMAAPDNLTENRFKPSAVLLGPGWGKGEERKKLFESYLPMEKEGLPLILDADAISLAKNIVFSGNAIITPHIGEFAAYTGLEKESILNDPIPVLKEFAAEMNVYILLKSHVMYIASPDKKIGIVDGMEPLLATGGSGDVLAGFCVAIAARLQAVNQQAVKLADSAQLAASSQIVASAQLPKFDGYACAVAAASLLLEAAKADSVRGRFIDPAELAHAAAEIAGSAWITK